MKAIDCMNKSKTTPLVQKTQRLTSEEKKKITWSWTKEDEKEWHKTSSNINEKTLKNDPTFR